MDTLTTKESILLLKRGHRKVRKRHHQMDVHLLGRADRDHEAAVTRLRKLILFSIPHRSSARDFCFFVAYAENVVFL
jgi:hypothetical protein